MQQGDSSVQFNPGELIELEEERVQRAERSLERELEAEREERLLRMRLEFEAQSRADLARAELEHEVAMREIERRARPGRWPLATSVGAFVATVVLVIGTYLGYFAPELARARDRARAATVLAETRAEEVQALDSALRLRTRQIEHMEAELTQRGASPSGRPDAKAKPERPSRSHVRRGPARRDGLEDLDLDSEDPLQGIK